MKKLALALITLFSLNIKAADHNDTFQDYETPEIIAAEQTEAATPELRISDIQTQAPMLLGYFISSLGSGLACGIGTGLARSAFTQIDAPYDFACYGTFLSQALWNAWDKEQEAMRCAEIAAHGNENLIKKCKAFADQQMGDGNEAQKALFAYILYSQMDKFQPEQFEVKNRAYSVAATILGFAAGAYVGHKIGAGMYNGCAWLWNKYYPATPVIGDNYIVLADTLPKQ